MTENMTVHISWIMQARRMLLVIGAFYVGAVLLLFIPFFQKQ